MKKQLIKASAINILAVYLIKLYTELELAPKINPDYNHNHYGILMHCLIYPETSP